MRGLGCLLRGPLLLLRHFNPIGFGLLRIDVHVLRGAALIDLERLIRIHGWSWLGVRSLYQIGTLILGVFKVSRCIIVVMVSDEGAATQMDDSTAQGGAANPDFLIDEMWLHQICLGVGSIGGTSHQLHHFLDVLRVIPPET